MTVTLTEPTVHPGAHVYGARKVWAAAHLTPFFILFFFPFYRPGMEYLTKCNTKEGSNGESIEQDIKMKWQKWAQILPYQQLFKMSMYKMLQLKNKQQQKAVVGRIS